MPPPGTERIFDGSRPPILPCRWPCRRRRPPCLATQEGGEGRRPGMAIPPPATCTRRAAAPRRPCRAVTVGSPAPDMVAVEVCRRPARLNGRRSAPARAACPADVVISEPFFVPALSGGHKKRGCNCRYEVYTSGICAVCGFFVKVCLQCGVCVNGACPSCGKDPCTVLACSDAVPYQDAEALGIADKY